MNVYRLEHFPKVCRICLQHRPECAMSSLDTFAQSYDVPFVDVAAELQYPISPDLLPLTPTIVCETCCEELHGFLVYRKRLRLVGQFILCLVRLRAGESTPLEQLFQNHQKELLKVLRELNITSTHKLVFKDLLDEFNGYNHGKPAYSQPIQPHSFEVGNEEHFTEEIDEQVSEEVDCNEEKLHVEKIMESPSDGKLQNETDSSGRMLRSRHHPKGELQQCQQCSFKTHFAKSFQLHMRKHRKDKSSPRHECNRCSLEFSNKRELVQHKRSSHRDHMCDTCGLAFDTKFVLETHAKRHATVRQYKCDYCPLEYYTKAEMLLHVRRLHLKAFEVNCPQCALTFSTKQILAQHMKTHTNQRTHTCTICGFSFKAHTHLNRHMKERHQGVQYPCDHCDVSYRRKDKLRMHVEKTHNVSSRIGVVFTQANTVVLFLLYYDYFKTQIQTYFVCDICLQSYDADEKLKEHQAHHRQPKDLQCGICLGAYLTEDEFNQHLCITYRENYICCNRDFKYHFFYNKHMFLVHGEQTNVRVKPVDGMLLGQYRAKRKQAERCPKCEQEFPTRHQKKQHMETCGSVGQIGRESEDLSL
uniref:C2H2-type domain-containing protein n=1 Tax=Anopheles dirus TaxID=7168 RepID=A0A182N899_9DIPT